METELTTPAIDNVAMAREYFIRVGKDRNHMEEIFTDDVQIFFPKFGTRRGKSALTELVEGLNTVFDVIHHDLDSYLFLPSGNYVVVEGTTSGRMKSGKTWHGGKTSGGRFCNVFEFRGGLIARLHVHLDPDYVGEDTPRFLWGSSRPSW